MESPAVSDSNSASTTNTPSNLSQSLFSRENLRPGTHLYRLFQWTEADLRRYQEWIDLKKRILENDNPISLRDQQISYYTRHFPNFIHVSSALQEYQEDPNAKRIKRAFESCPFKTTIAGVGGFVIGSAFGLFGASVDPMSTVFGTETPTTKQVLQEMGRRCYSMGKSFAIIGMLIGGSECAFESYRGKTGLSNALYAGLFAGGVTGMRAGPQAAVLGGLGFAAFSLVMELYLHHR